MTSLIAWVGVDNRGPSSVYLASDSRFSGNESTWDFGRKLFACVQRPDIFAYCGAVLFPSQILGQLAAAIDGDLLFARNATPAQRFHTITEKIRAALQGFPESQYAFSIAYATRDGEGFGATFAVYTLSWRPSNGWKPKVGPCLITQTCCSHTDLGQRSRKTFTPDGNYRTFAERRVQSFQRFVIPSRAGATAGLVVRLSL